MPGARQAATNPAAVSSTKFMSRTGSSAPTETTSEVIAWASTAGRNARADCRGPYMLNGRRIVTGIPKLRWYDSASAPAPILLAA